MHLRLKNKRNIHKDYLLQWKTRIKINEVNSDQSWRFNDSRCRAGFTTNLLILLQIIPFKEKLFLVYLLFKILT